MMTTALAVLAIAAAVLSIVGSALTITVRVIELRSVKPRGLLTYGFAPS